MGLWVVCAKDWADCWKLGGRKSCRAIGCVKETDEDQPFKSGTNPARESDERRRQTSSAANPWVFSASLLGPGPIRTSYMSGLLPNG